MHTFVVGNREATATWQAIKRYTSHAVDRGIVAGSRLLDNALAAIHWKPAPLPQQAEVVTRASLAAEPITTSESGALSAYRNLFSSYPVDVPGLLVGRQAELQAIAEAYELWEKGRRVSVLIVGRSGSGKTSLVNVAAKTVMGGGAVVRGQIRQRVTTKTALRAEIAGWLGIQDPAKLECALLEQRRVVVLEQVEHAFLRTIGQCGAIRELQRLIAATASTTLWVATVSANSFTFLDSAIAMGRSFSHRINLGVASRDDLRRAIELRHGVSGFAFRFGNPPLHHNPAKRLASRLRSNVNGETLFFESLQKESAGLFRTALEIWSDRVERVESGIVYVKPAAQPDLSTFAEALDIPSLFTLGALLQHGGLTVEEHADVFQQSITESRTQIDHLAAREIIEPIPLEAGFRVHPEALLLVHETLHRRNLL